MRLVVIGGGITGLAAAHRALELASERALPLEVRLLEASGRLGGTISTARRDGFVLEDGPDSMITDKPWGVALARRLGMEDEIIGTAEAHRRSFVVRNGELLPVPEGFQLLAPSRFGPLVRTPIFSLAGKARMALDLLIPRRQENGDESLGSFVLRRLGREALDRIAQPMIAGIYGADPMQLSLDATLPRFREMERRHGSVIRGMWSSQRRSGRSSEREVGISGARYGLFVSFRDGMQSLADRLAARLPPGCAALDTAVEGLSHRGDGWTITVRDGAALEADAVIVALPAHGAARVAQDVEPDLARMLAEIPYASAGTMTLCYRREDVPHPMDGFGFVVPSSEGLTILGCTFSHVKWASRAPEGYALLRAFLGEDAIRDRDDDQVGRLVRADLAVLLGVTAEPEFIRSWRGERAMPQYRVGHLERIAEIERLCERIPGFELAGNAYRGVGVPDCIHSGEQAAERILRDAAR